LSFPQSTFAGCSPQFAPPPSFESGFDPHCGGSAFSQFYPAAGIG